MTVKECIKEMMRDRRYTQTILAEKIGKRQGDVSMFLSRSEGMRIDTLLMLANACDYHIELVDNGGSGKRYVIGDESVADEVDGAAMAEPGREPTMAEMFSAFQEWYEQTHPGR